MYTHTDVARLGEQIALTGLAAHAPELQRLADQIRHVSPPVAELLIDPSAPDVLRLRAFAVAAGHATRRVA